MSDRTSVVEALAKRPMDYDQLFEAVNPANRNVFDLLLSNMKRNNVIRRNPDSMYCLPGWKIPEEPKQKPGRKANPKAVQPPEPEVVAPEPPPVENTGLTKAEVLEFLRKHQQALIVTAEDIGRVIEYVEKNG